MLIDWFTVVAQLVNFAILVVALKFLLYDRVVEAMETRRRGIAEREATAEERIREAEEELGRLRRERRELEVRRDEILEEASREADTKRRELLRRARTEVAVQEEEWWESIRSRQRRLLDDLQRLTGEKAVGVSRRLLADMADRSLEEALVAGLAERLVELPAEKQSAIAESVRDETSVLVRSSFVPSEAGKETIEKALSELDGGVGRSVHWEQDPELVAGLVISVGAHRIGWSVAGYLEEVEGEFAALLRADRGQEKGE